MKDSHRQTCKHDMADRQTGRQTDKQIDRKIVSLELRALGLIQINTTFFVLTYLGRFDFGTSLFQTMAGCPAMAELNNTGQVEIKSKIMENSNLLFLFVIQLISLGSLDHMITTLVT